VLAYLERREEQWTRHWLQAEVQRRAADPRERLLAIFDVFDEWLHQTGFEGCSFINVMLETADDRDSIYRASIAYLWHPGLPRATRPRRRHRRRGGLRAQVAHPHEGLDRRRRRGRPRRRQARAADGSAAPE